ncbi:MAG: hypothetical protein O9327_08575 [Polaromonas sp.]|nr:hypothetical protein [Polaromonas sp.]
MPTPSPQILETYTLLQIAAEAFLGRDPAAPAARAGDAPPLLLTDELLKVGNRHSSRMTAVQAVQFAREWKVISHQPNTATGFSATLFEYIGETDPARGVTKDMQVRIPGSGLAFCPRLKLFSRAKQKGKT